MRFLSLFSGIGAIDLGLERAGWTCVGQVELEPFCQKVLAKHWPDVWRWDDVRTLDGEKVRANCGPIDAIVGGSPCQDLSVAGKGEGLSGPRSSLWFEYLRLVQELRPNIILFENVPGARTRGADTIIAGLENANYSCWPFVVGARHVGAPHRRDRVWIVAMANGQCSRLEGQRSFAGRTEVTELRNGDPLADATSEGRGPTRDAGHEGESGAGPFLVATGTSEGLADPTCELRERDGGARRRWAESSDAGSELGNSTDEPTSSEQELKPEESSSVIGSSGSQGVAHTSGDDVRHFEQRVPEGWAHGVRDQGQAESRGYGSEGLADSDGTGFHRVRNSGELVQGIRTSLRYDTHGCRVPQLWPARPGEPQFIWEASRTTQPELGSAADGSSKRLARLASRRRRDALKAIGNSAVPQVAEALGLAISKSVGR